MDRRQCIVKEEKVGGTFNEEKIKTVSNPQIREALLRRLAEFGDAKKAFTGKNSLDKNPVYIDDDNTKQVSQKVKTVTYEDVFTIRKPIDKDLKINKVGMLVNQSKTT